MPRGYRVAFDARLFDAPPTGIGRWTRGLLGALLARQTPHRWIALGNAEAIRAEHGDHPQLELIDTRPRRMLIWQLLRLPGLLRRARAEVLFSPWNLCSALGFRGRQLLMLHDLIPFRAETHGFRPTYRWKTELLWRLARPRYERMIVVSRFTGDDARRTLGVPERKLAVIHPGVEGGQARSTTAAEQAAARGRYGLPERYVLALGGGEPRKNQRLAIEAWLQLTPEARAGHTLALAGSPFRGQRAIDAFPDAGAQAVVDVGRLPDDDLAPLLGAASLFVYPSLFEGFGLPPLEALACGTPALAVDATSLPEALGGAGALAAPTPEAFAAEIARLLGDPAARQQQLERAPAHLAQFTWDVAADKLLELLQRGPRPQPTGQGAYPR